MVRRLDVLLERLHETEFRESYQTTNLFHSSLCPIGQISASLWNSLSVCKYVCLEGGGGEILGHQIDLQSTWKRRPRKEKSSRDTRKPGKRRRKGEGKRENLGELERKKFHVCLSPWVRLLKIAMSSFSAALSVVPRPTAFSAPGNLWVPYQLYWIFNSGGETPWSVLANPPNDLNACWSVELLSIGNTSGRK